MWLAFALLYGTGMRLLEGCGCGSRTSISRDARSSSGRRRGTRIGARSCRRTSSFRFATRSHARAHPRRRSRPRLRRRRAAVGTRSQISERGSQVGMAVRLPRRVAFGRSAHRRHPPAPPARMFRAARGQGRGIAGTHREVGVAAHLAARIRDPPAAARPRYLDGAGIARPRQRGDDDDPYAHAEPRRARRDDSARRDTDHAQTSPSSEIIRPRRRNCRRFDSTISPIAAPRFGVPEGMPRQEGRIGEKKCWCQTRRVFRFRPDHQVNRWLALL